MRILILGGTGIISTGITRLLLEAGDTVTHFNRGLRPSLFASAVTTLIGERGSAAALAAAAQGRYDAVIDMIGFTEAEAALAAVAFAGRTDHYVFCSTVDVYTKPALAYPIGESHPRAASPAFPYAYQKMLAEDRLRRAEAEGAFALTILRPAATYDRGIVAPVGPASLYLDRVRRGLPIALHGDGSSLWVATHRDDVAQAFVGALRAAVSRGRAYNVASEETMTWETYWRIAAAAIGAPEPSFVPIPTEMLVAMLPDLAEWCGLNFRFHNLIDSSAARRDLSFAPKIGWAEGAMGLRDFDDPPPADLAARYDLMLRRWLGAMADVVRAAP